MTSAPLRAPPGTKFIIVFTLPSGAQMAAGGVGDKFALMPIPQNGQLNSVLAWDDSRQVAQWMKAFKRQVGDQEWAKLMELRPALGRVTVTKDLSNPSAH